MADISILFCGDICFMKTPDVDAEKSKEIISELKPVFDSADMLVMNLETPIADEGIGAPIYKCGPNIIGRQKNLGFLTESGCDLAVLANNHTKDFGEEALVSTFKELDKIGMPYVGAGMDVEEAYKAWRGEVGGKKISIIAVCENEFGNADFHVSGTAGYDLERLGDKIAEEKVISDYVIVSFHGGCEHNPLPSPHTVERYRLLITLGADAVIGGHPHCIQGIETYKNKPIVYSVGNFYFTGKGMWKPTQTCSNYGLIANVKISDNGVAVETIPVYTNEEGTKITLLEGDEKKRLLDYIDKISEPIKDREKLVHMFKGWCMSRGFDYAKGNAFLDEYFEADKQPAPVAKIQNLYDCEAHNELIRTTMTILYEGEFAKAKEWEKELQDYFL